MFRSLTSAIRKYPKTSAFASCLTIYFGVRLYSKHKDNLLRHRLCSQLKNLGFERVSEDGKLQRVTVFLNPFAHRREILNKFDMNAMPLLQISGLDVQMVYLDDDDQVKQMTSVLEPSSTDAVIVAGDDNLVAKALTGLLRRKDYMTTELWRIPVYVLPLGIFNNYSSSIIKDTNPITWCYEMIQPILKQQSSRRNVLCIRPLREDESNLQPDASKKEVFALTGVEWSCWRDVEYGGGGLSLTASQPASHKPRLVASPEFSETTANSAFWQFYTPRQVCKRLAARIRHAWTYIRSPDFNPQPPSQEQLEVAHKKAKPIRRGCAKAATLVVKPACPGCKKCCADKKAVKHSTLSRLFGLSSYVGPAAANRVAEAEGASPPDFENPGCGSTITLRASPASRILVTMEGDHLCLSVSPAARGLLDYVRDGMRHVLAPAYHCDSPVQPLSIAGGVFDSPLDIVSDGQEFSLLCSSVILSPSRTDGEYFWIDNDSFEACPIEVSVLKGAVNSFPLLDGAKKP